MAGGENLKVNVTKIVSTLLVSQLIPLCIGLVIRKRRPELAERLKKPASTLGTVLNLVVFSAILVVQYRLLSNIHLTGFLDMLLLVGAFTLCGWLLGGPGPGDRKAVALSTGIRNVGVSPVIATGTFPGTPAVTAALAFAIFQTIVLALAAAAWGRLSHDDTGAVQKLAA